MNLYVIGRPINHSLSPLIHNYWLKKYKKKEVYGKLDLNEKDLQNIIKKISNQEILGVNVTIPYKQKTYSRLWANEKNSYHGYKPDYRKNREDCKFKSN